MDLGLWLGRLRRREVLADRVPLVLACIQALVILGPVLGPGVAVSYDMAWSPDPRWTPFVTGVDTPAPRAVPSDAVAVLVGQIVGAGVAQSLILGGVLVALGTGTAALAGEIGGVIGPLARCTAVVAGVWNPFVYERLMVGQWTIIAGLALLPWALLQVVRLARGDGSARSLAGLTVAAGLGGANTLIMVLSAVVPSLIVLAVGRRRATVRPALLTTVVVGAGMAAVWALPALAADADPSAGTSATAFVPQADSRLGVLGSIVSGGGLWNVAAHPQARMLLVNAGAAAVLALLGVVCVMSMPLGNARRALVAALGVPTTVVLLSITPALEPLWVTLVLGPPGGGILRDSHKFLGPWVIIASAGTGLIAHAVTSRGWRAAAGLLTPLLLTLPVALTTYLAWGGLGRLSAVEVPADYRAAMAQLSAHAHGDVGLLPWSQYRRYPWNEGRVSLTLAPRMMSRIVLFDDSLPLRSGTVSGESVRADEVSQRIAEGDSPVEALRLVGVDTIVLERTAAGLAVEDDVRRAGSLLISTENVLVVRLAPSALEGARELWSVRVGWTATLLTALVVGGLSAVETLRRSRAKAPA
jgi:hypothetical protein